MAYGTIDIAIWSDRKFRALTPSQPCGQTLWMYLLAPRERLRIPGVIPAGEATISESLRWPLDATKACFAEIVVQGMAEVDPSGPLIWLPNALKHNRPANPNQVKGWGKDWLHVPECPLKLKAWRSLKADISALGEAFAAAFTASFPEPSSGQFPEPFTRTVTRNRSGNGSRKGSRNGRGEQEQKQEQEALLAGARAKPADESPGAGGGHRTSPKRDAARANAASGEGATPQRPDGGDAAAGGIPAEPSGAAGRGATAGASGSTALAAESQEKPAPEAVKEASSGAPGAETAPARPELAPMRAPPKAVRFDQDEELRPRRRPTPVVNLVDKPLVAEFHAQLQRAVAHGVVVAKAGEGPAVAGELEEILAVQTVEQALRFVLTTARRRGETPGSLTWCLTVLRDMPAPEDLRPPAQASRWDAVIAAMTQEQFAEFKAEQQQVYQDIVEMNLWNSEHNRLLDAAEERLWAKWSPVVVRPIAAAGGGA